MSSSNTSVRVAHRHWNKTPPSGHQINNIRQIWYRIVTKGVSRRKGLVDVWAENLYAKNKDSRHWRWFPAVYTDHLNRILYRLSLYIEIMDFLTLNRSQSPPAAISEIKIYINYIDKVLDDIWEEVRMADQNNMLTAIWRSPSLDKWLIMEYTIGRHDEESVRNASAEWNVDEMGQFISGNPMELDWVEYDERTPDWHHGAPYDYDAKNMTSRVRAEVAPHIISWLLKDNGKENETDEDAAGGSKRRRRRKATTDKDETTKKDKGRRRKSKLKESSSENDESENDDTGRGKKTEKGKKKEKEDDEKGKKKEKEDDEKGKKGNAKKKGKRVRESDSEASEKVQTKSTPKAKSQRKRKGKDDAVTNKEGEAGTGERKTMERKSKRSLEIPLATRRSVRKTTSTYASGPSGSHIPEDPGSSTTGVVPRIIASSSKNDDDEWQPGIPSAGGFKSKSKSREISVTSTLSKLTATSRESNKLPLRGTPSGSPKLLAPVLSGDGDAKNRGSTAPSA